MGGRLEAVVDSGPVIHLREINALAWTRLFKRLHYPPAVYAELSKHHETLRVLEKKAFRETKLRPETKKHAELICLKYNLSIAESEAIALAKQEKAKLFLTDDLEARLIAKKLDLTAAGSVGLLLRSYREGLTTVKQTEKHLRDLLEDSSLFITPNLIEDAITKAKGYRR